MEKKSEERLHQPQFPDSSSSRDSQFNLSQMKISFGLPRRHLTSMGRKEEKGLSKRHNQEPADPSG